MCGICGERSFRAPVDQRTIERMRDTLAHRGPDAEGAYVDARVGLGHRRLSIIDRSPRGRQPMWTDDGRMALIFNGEVYNHAEIRPQLESRGYRFHSRSDTEVVLNAVHCFGIEQAVAKFIGMFAFAVWDAAEETLYLCRDRAGIKPLFYYGDDERFLFASELKALLSHPGMRRELDPAGIAQFFVVGNTLGGTSAFRNTHRLLPGHYLTLRPDGTVTTHQYWALDQIERGSFRGSFDDAAAQLTELCDSAFNYRLVSDVPVGVFLSGGIDSSLLAAFLAKRAGQDLLHITIGFRESRYDEAPKAASVARQLGLRHMVRYVEAPEAARALERFVGIFDEPFSDTSGIPMAILSQVAREHVTVALSADGGDEQFCGYESYGVYAREFARASRVPPVVRGAAAALLGRLVPYRLLLSGAVAARNGGLRQPQLVARYEKWVRLLQARSPADVVRLSCEKAFTPDAAAGLLRATTAHAFRDTVLWAPGLDVREDGLIDAMMRTDYCAFMRDDVLTKVDRTSMAVSLECRDPLLDHRISEFAFSLPLEYLYDGVEHKRILKHLLRQWLAETEVSAPKQGFVIPLYHWMRGPWKPIVMDYLSPARVRRVGVLDDRAVTREVRRFYRYQGLRAERVLVLLLFQMWAEKWYVGQPAL